MKKSLMSLLFSAAMVFTLFSVPVMAAGTEEIQVSAESQEEIVTQSDADVLQSAEDVITENDSEVSEDAQITETPDADEQSEIESVGVADTLSANTTIKLKAVESESYYKDPKVQESHQIAEATFKSSNDSNPSIDVDRITVTTDDGKEDSKNYGFVFTADGNKLMMSTPYYLPEPGTYIFTVYPTNSKKYTEYSYTIKPDYNYVNVYVNKVDGNQSIYTDGKKKLSLSLSATTRLRGSNKTENLKNVSYSLEHISGTTACTVENGKLIIPSGFSGEEYFQLCGEFKNKAGTTVKGSILVTVTSAAEEPALLRFGNDFKPDVITGKYIITGSPVYDTDSNKKLTISANVIDDMYIKAYDKDGNPIVSTITAKGKSLKVEDYSASEGLYMISATGKAGETVITATSKNGSKTQSFTINVTKYDNSNIALYTYEDDTKLPDSYTNTQAGSICLYVADAAGSEYSLSPSVGDYKLTAKGGKLVGYSYRNSIYLQPNAEKTVLTLKTGKTTKTYTITNTAYSASLPKAGNASVTIYQTAADDITVTGKVKNMPASATRLILVSDETKSYKGSKSVTYYSLDSGLTASVSGNTLAVTEKTNTFEYAKGSYPLIAYPVNAAGEYVAKPITLKVKVVKVPKAAVSLKTKSFKVEQAVGKTAKVEIKALKNIDKIQSVSIANVKNGTDYNDFISYFDLSDVNISDKTANLVLTDTNVQKADLKGSLRIKVVRKDGNTATISVPINVSLNTSK